MIRSLVRTRIATTALLLTLGSTACGGAPTAVSSPGEKSRAADPQQAEVLNFEAPNLEGGVLRGADYVGKDVAFWFWAPW